MIAGCLRGNDQARALFYVQYARLVHRAVSRKLSSLATPRPLQSEVEDICGEVFARIFAQGCRALSQLRNPESINAWLVTLAQHSTVDYLRKWSEAVDPYPEQTRETPSSYGSDCEEKVSASERNLVLGKCLAQLSEQERLIVNLFYVEGLKYAEIAEIMSMNINTMSAKLRRAKGKLRKLLEVERYETISGR